MYYIYLYIYIYAHIHIINTYVSGFELSFEKWSAKSEWVFPTAMEYWGALQAHLLGLLGQNVIQMQENCVQINTFFEYDISKLSSLKCKQKLHGFTGDKNSNRRDVFICKFHRKLLKVIHKKTKPIRVYAIRRSLIWTLYIPKNVCI